MKLKLAKCVKQWYVNAVVSHDAKFVTLNFNDQMVRKMLQMFSPENAKKEDENLVENIFFGLPMK